MTHPGQIFSRDQLLSEVWGYAAMVNTRTVDVHVAQLRGKLGENNIIRTVRGVGYGAGERVRPRCRDAPNEVLSGSASSDNHSRSSLGLRTVLVTTLVALLAVLMTGLAALPLLRDAELRDQRRQLSQLADAAAASTQTSGPLTDEIQERLINTLRQEQVSLALISPGGTTPDGVSGLSVAPIWTTGKVSSTYSQDGQCVHARGPAHRAGHRAAAHPAHVRLRLRAAGTVGQDRHGHRDRWCAGGDRGGIARATCDQTFAHVGQRSAQVAGR